MRKNYRGYFTKAIEEETELLGPVLLLLHPGMPHIGLTPLHSTTAKNNSTCKLTLSTVYALNRAYESIDPLPIAAATYLAMILFTELFLATPPK